MSKKRGSNKSRVSLIDLLEYIKKHQYSRYIFSSRYYRDGAYEDGLHENINAHTLRMNLVFKKMKIIFNPNQILLYNFLDCKSTESQYIAIDRVKYAMIKETATGIKIDFVSGNLSNDIDNHTYTVFAEFVTK